MMHVLPPFSNACVHIAAVALLLGACAAPVPTVPISSAVSAHLPPSPSLYQLTQLDYGAQATYGFCTLPSCPAITRKTPASVATLSVPLSHVVPPTEPITTKVPIAPHFIEPDLDGEAPLMVHFATGSAVIDQTAQRALQHLAKQASMGSRIRIAGRTDSTGSLVRNAALAHQRALNVAGYLRAQLDGKGVLLEIESAGVCCYRADNASSVGRQSNRRVEVTVAAGDLQQVRQ